jgi:DNA polymerase-3 subunit gamma/tau
MERRRVAEPEKAREEPDLPIHIKYRPRRLSEVVGQKDVVNSLKTALKAATRPHAYLFMGPPGTGKTTLSRIVADDVGVPAASIQEIDAATHSGVDDVERLLQPLAYKGFGDSPNKAIIMDECHRLSKQAWDKFLKITEEGPPHVFFFFCTSEPDKVPDAMQRRCLAYTLKPARFNDIMDVLEHVCEAEHYDTPSGILKLVADAAYGSPGMALMMLAKVHACEHEDEAAGLLETVNENPEVIDLCRALIRRELNWKKLTTTLKGLDLPPESIRIVIVNYLGGCLMNPKGGDRDIEDFLYMLEPFLKPFNSSDKMAPLLAAFGRILYPA